MNKYLDIFLILKTNLTNTLLLKKIISKADTARE
jgi:hypothetical protein